MKKKIFYLIIFDIIIIISGLAVFLTLGKKTISENKNYNESVNEIFTEDIYKQLIEIDYWNGDTKVVINNEAGIKNIYHYLSSLKLKEQSPEEEQKYGHLLINLVTKKKTIPIGLLSGEIIINGKNYYIDKDICEAIRKIVKGAK